MNLGDIVNWIKLPAKYLLPVALLVTALLFLPSTVLSKFGLDAFVESYRMWVGLVCLAAWSILLSHVGFLVKHRVGQRRRIKRERERRHGALRRLSPEEKIVLSEFILLKTKTQKLDITSGVANGLVHAQIIYRSASVGDILDGFAYNMQPWAWEELNAHQELLEPELSARRAHL